MVQNTHLLKGHMLQVHIGIASMRQFQYVPTTYVTGIKETFFKIYTKYHVHWFSSFKHLKLPTGIKIPITIWQIVYFRMTAISPNMIS